MNFSKSIATFAGVLALGVGFVLFTAWVSVGPLAPPWCFVAKANSALSLFLCGLTLLLMRATQPTIRVKCVASGALIVVATVAVVNLFEWTTNRTTGFNEIFSTDPFSHLNNMPPGRLTLPAAIGYASLVVGLFSLRFRTRGWIAVRSVAGIVPVAIGSFSLLGYLYRAQSMYRMGMPLLAISPLGGTVLLFLGLGVLFAHAEGPAAILSSDRPGGKMARRAWPYLVCVIVAFGCLRDAGERMQLYDSPSGTALLVFALLGVVATVLWLNARRLDQEDLEKSLAVVELATKNSLLDAVIESMPNGLIVTDEYGKVLLANLAARATAEADLVGQNRGDFAHFEFSRDDGTPLTRAEMPLAAALAGKRVDEMPITVRGPNSVEPRHLRVSTRPLFHDGGKVRGAAVLFTDVTERRRLEEHRKESIAALRRSNEDLQQFASIVSHDLQEPLRTVASYISLTKRSLGADVTPRTAEFMAFVSDGAERMKRLLESLLEFSRVTSHGRALEPVEADLALHDALENLQMTIKARGAAIAAQPLPRAKADPVQLAQLFQNLVGNAIKYCTQQPVIEVFADAAADGFTRFAVRDNGIGIEMRYADRIFQIFQRLHSREEYEGTGVGLAVCKRIVERHGGRMWIESTPGEGSTFYFTLPGA